MDGNQPLEKQLSKVLAYLEFLAVDWKETMMKHEVQRKEREERERLIQEVRDRKQKEKEKFKELLNQANRWNQSQILREYINKFEENSIKNDALSDEIKSWITLARQKVDWYDPFINKEDNYLTDIDIEELE